MKSIFRSVAAIVLASTAAVGTASASTSTLLQEIAKDGELRVCFDAGYMPFEMTAKNGQYIGFDIDLGRQMARAMGVKYTPVNTAWAVSYTHLTLPTIA